ncbi:MHYT domain-containing protein [Nocardia sp. NPDC004722]
MIYFSMGYWVIVLALIVSFAGAACGLACIRQSTKSVTQKFRLVWLFVASISIGGVGVAMPIFVSMLGFDVKGSQLRYDNLSITLFSVVAATTVLIAMVLNGKRLVWWRLLVGAALMAVGFGGVHQLLLNAIRIQGTVDQSLVSTVAVYVIAFVLSALTLWFSLWVSSVPLVLLGALVYAVLVTGMHYAGLTGLQVHLDPAQAQPQGNVLFNFFVPFFIVGTLSLAIPITAILVAPDRREARAPIAPPEPPAAPTLHSTSLQAASQQAAAYNGRR